MDVEQLQNLDLFAEFTDLCIPLFIFKCQSSGEKIGPAIKATADRLRCYAELTESGWMNDKVFTWYIAEIVNSWLVGKRFGKPLDHLKVHLQPGDTKALVMDVHPLGQALGAEGRELIRQRFNALTRMVGGSGT